MAKSRKNTATKIASLAVRNEYVNGAICLQDVLRQHLAFCLQFDFDQILQSDKIEVKCLECGSNMRVTFNELTTKLFCKQCCNTTVTKEHIAKLSERLRTISTMLLTTY